MQRGSCPFALKVTNAQAAGAVGAIIFNSGTPGNEGVVAGTLGETAQDGQPTPPDVTIPAVGISYAEGDRLRRGRSHDRPDRRRGEERPAEVDQHPGRHPLG